jgi:hypothetical protein
MQTNKRRSVPQAGEISAFYEHRIHMWNELAGWWRGYTNQLLWCTCRVQYDVKVLIPLWYPFSVLCGGGAPAMYTVHCNKSLHIQSLWFPTMDSHLHKELLCFQLKYRNATSWFPSRPVCLCVSCASNQSKGRSVLRYNHIIYSALEYN